MDLLLPMERAEGYRSASQRARVVTEAWAERNLYCLACPSPRLDAHTAGTRVEDFHCPRCDARYQLKSKAGAFSGQVTNSAYAAKMEAIRASRAPNYAFLAYDGGSASVTDLFVLPGHFLVPSVVRPRSPLRPTAQRAGWIGSTILLRDLPPEARVPVVRAGEPRAPRAVREDFARFGFLREMRAEARGWTADVLACARAIGRNQFTLQDVYAFEGELQRRHPGNRNVRPKIRQQLQVLRDRGVLRFEGKGAYCFTG